MSVLLWIVSFIAYNLIGCWVLSAVDRHGDLMRWYDRAPNVLSQSLFWLFWPVVVVCYRWNLWRAAENRNGDV